MTQLHVREYRTADKSEWGDGPWQNEPDKMQWVDEATGLPCLIVRNRSGALCGYAGVPNTHPWYKKQYNDPIEQRRDPTDIPVEGAPFGAMVAAILGEESFEEYATTVEGNVRVHGGLSYSDLCQHGDDEAHGVCHVPEPGSPDDIWWFGFDCAHANDACPGVNYFHDMSDFQTYRDIEYVRGEVEGLARDLAAAA